jgi:hypothetical protein
MKTILVPTEDNSAVQSALDTALVVVRRCDSYIEGFALRWSIAEFAAFDPTGGIHQPNLQFVQRCGGQKLLLRSI